MQVMPTLQSVVDKIGHSNEIMVRCEFQFQFQLVLLQNDTVQNFLPIFTKFCTQLRNVVHYKSGVSYRKQ